MRTEGNPGVAPKVLSSASNKLDFDTGFSNRESTDKMSLVHHIGRDVD